MPTTTEPLWRKLAWFAALYVASFAAVALVALALRAMLHA